MKADLHTHTTVSDGVKTREEVLQKAKDNGIDIIAITDHDICIHVEDNFRIAETLGIHYIPGIELSTLFKNKPVHILGYFTDDSYQSKEMLAYYQDIKDKRDKRAKTFITNLKREFNIEIDYDDVLGFSRGIIARPHIAKAITKKYPQYSFDYVFDHFIGDHTKAYVPACEITVQEGIDLLRRNNCIIVLAHPTLLKEYIQEKVLSFEYDGIEAVYYRNKENEEQLFRTIAKDREMIVTGGSDYHGIKNDTKHGDVGEVYITGKDVEKFLSLFK